MNRQKLEKFMTNLFGIFVSIAVLGGVFIFFTYLVGIIIGGDAGSSLMVTAKSKFVPLFIKSATIAVMAGLLIFYITGKHTLSLKDEEEGNDD